MQLTDHALTDRLWAGRQIPHPEDSFVMIDSLEVILEVHPPTVMPCSMTSAVSRWVRVFPSMAFEV